MPFNYKEYEQQCSTMSKVQLKQEIDRQSDTIAGAGAGTGLALLAGPITMGISAIAVAGTAPALINARKKRQIARKYFEAAGPAYHTAPSPFRAGSPGSNSKRNMAGANNVVSSSSSKVEEEEQLPAYTPGDHVPDVREKQTYVPVEDVAMELPPSYDDAASTAERPSRTSTRDSQRPAPPSISISTAAEPDLQRSHSTSSRESSTHVDPRTPLFSHPVRPIDLIDVEDVSSEGTAAAAHNKGKANVQFHNTNPFLAPGEREI